MIISGTDDIEISADGLTISAHSHNSSQRASEDLMNRTAGTHLQGCITTPFARLVELFGAPYQHAQANGDGKVRAEWHIKVFASEDEDDGATFSGIATIYDWKQDLPVGSVTQWNIGGKDRRVVHYLSMLLNGVPSEWNARTY
jgi:hypothetical protein